MSVNSLEDVTCAFHENFLFFHHTKNRLITKKLQKGVFDYTGGFTYQGVKTKKINLKLKINHVIINACDYEPWMEGVLCDCKELTIQGQDGYTIDLKEKKVESLNLMFYSGGKIIFPSKLKKLQVSGDSKLLWPLIKDCSIEEIIVLDTNLSSIPEEIKNKSSLVSLTIQGALKRLGADSLISPVLRYLDLSANNLEFIATDFLKHKDSLQTLLLSNNNMNYLNFIIHYKNLRIIDFSYNNLTYLSDIVLSLGNLRVLSLSHNGIMEADKNFDPNTHGFLRVFTLFGNPIIKDDAKKAILSLNKDKDKDEQENHVYEPPTKR